MIVNKSGGLVYERQRRDSRLIQRLSSNECLIVASTLQGVNEIVGTVGSFIDNKKPRSKVERIDWSGADATSPFSIFCTHTPTGIKFIAIATPETNGIETLLGSLYRLYCDWALKNPFQLMDMPVRSERFDQEVSKLLG